MTTTIRIATLNPLLLRTVSFLCARVHHRRLGLGLAVPSDRAWCSGVTESTRPESPLSSTERLRPLKHPRWDDPDYYKWKDKEWEINDIKVVVLLAKEILYSDRYIDGEQPTEEDEKIGVERLLAYHPHSEDKIGCRINYVMLNDSVHGPPVFPSVSCSRQLHHQSNRWTRTVITTQPERRRCRPEAAFLKFLATTLFFLLRGIRRNEKGE